MSLVAYDNSDSSDCEDDSPKPEVIIPSKNVQADVKPSTSVISEESEVEATEQCIFNLLPQPSMKKQIVTEEDDEFLHKKEDPTNVPKPKAKIMVPSLSDFKDVDNVIKINKPRTSNGKKCGLLGILPQPRNSFTMSTKSLIPQVLTSKKSLPAPSITTTVSKNTPKTSLFQDSDDSDEDDVQTDFFSINKPVDIPVVDSPLESENNFAPSASLINSSVEKIPPKTVESYFKKTENVPSNLYEYEANGSIETEYLEENQQEQYACSSNGDVALDEEAILKLCGARGKRKREEIQIVHVNQQEVLADARQWLMKGLMDDTTKRVSSSKKKGNEPTHQQKRKHQITYLAHQAKANEAELQNQWANNRMSKRQTQSKYGF